MHFVVSRAVRQRRTEAGNVTRRELQEGRDFSAQALRAFGRNDTGGAGVGGRIARAVVCGIGGVVLLFACVGCGSVDVPEWGAREGVAEAEDGTAVAAGYEPVAISILPLTEVTETGRGANVHLYLELVDAFGTRIKAPARFRFELYSYAERQAEPRGKRIQVWDGFDLTDAGVNNRYWRNFLRCYEFSLELDFVPEANSRFVIQANYLSPGETRLTTQAVYP